MSEKNVLFVLHYPPPIHGASIVGQDIKDSQRVNDSFNCKYIGLSTSKTLKEIGKWSILKIIRYFILLGKVIYSLISFKPRLVYMTISSRGLGFYKDALVILIVKIFRIKLIYHLHNKGVQDHQDVFIENLFYKFAFRNVDVILLSGILYTDISKYITKERTHICPNGIKDINKNGVQNGIDSGQKAAEILFLSNLMKDKGINILLEACKLLKEREIDFYCNIIGPEGDISFSHLKDEISEMDLNGYINILGPKYKKDKEIYFLSADIFAFPSNYSKECFPLVLLEAMQYSLPIVSTFVGGIPDIVSDNRTGFIVKNDPTELADKLEILVKDKELRKRMGQLGRKYYLEQFTTIQFEERLINILEKVLEK